jgi:DNA-binding transcriptional LysR family regulator
MVKDCEVDVGILPGIEKSEDLHFNSLFKYERVLITPLNHPLLNNPLLTLEDIVKYPLILMEEHSYTRQLIENQLNNQGLNYKIAIELDSMDFIKQFVAIGMGVSIGPLLAIEKEDLKKISVVNINNILIPDEAGFITNPKKVLTNNSLSFIEALETGNEYK